MKYSTSAEAYDSYYDDSIYVAIVVIAVGIVATTYAVLRFNERERLLGFGPANLNHHNFYYCSGMPGGRS